MTELYGRRVEPGEVARAYRETFATPHGQIVLADMMRRFSYNTQTMFREGESDDGRGMAFRDGQRSVLIHLGYMMEVDPDEYQAAHEQPDEL